MFSSFRYVYHAHLGLRTGFARSSRTICLGIWQEGSQLTDAQRNLNNCFAYDLVPSPSVLTAALRAARRVNDFPSAVRVFEGTSPIRVPSHACTLFFAVGI